MLLVLVSVALSAGTITFVNKLDPLQKDLMAAKNDALVKQKLLSDAQDAVAAKETDLNTAKGDFDAQKASLQGSITDLTGKITERDVQVAHLNSIITQLTSANTAQSTALSVSEESKNKLSDQVVALRKDADERLRQVSDQGQRI